MEKNKLTDIYRILYAAYGPQGWWPLKSTAGKDGSDERGYHRGIYRYPANDVEAGEIIIGSILTQNTSWKNAEYAIDNLIALNCLTLRAIADCPVPVLAEMIRSSGYYNQKAIKLKRTAEYMLELKRRQDCVVPKREELLGLWGIGYETADTILLYAYRRPWFVVDAYTKRILLRLGLISEAAAYTDIQELFHSQVEMNVDVYNEYHALIVRHAKHHCMKKPRCGACPLHGLCDMKKE
ncbi:MAG: DNA repair protein [Spirochaetales bacterium]|nr:DNA repair protein [Spirochaetales bacterium]